MDLSYLFWTSLLELIYIFSFVIIFSVGLISIFSTSLNNTKQKKILFYLISELITLIMQLSISNDIVDTYLILKLTIMNSIFLLLGAFLGSNLAKHNLLKKVE